MSIRPQFLSVKSYTKQLQKRKWDQDAIEISLSRVKKYINQGKFEFKRSPEFEASEYSYRTVGSDFGPLCPGYENLILALTNDPIWLDQRKKTVAYCYVANRLSYHSQLKIAKDFNEGFRAQYLGMESSHRWAEYTGACLALGWDDWAYELAKKALHLFSIKGFIESDDVEARPGNRFIFRLIALHLGLPTMQEPPPSTDVPLLREVLAVWDREDCKVLEPLIMETLDRHTHQSRYDNNKEFFDVPNETAWYLPYEVLALFRLRQIRGLDIAPLEAIDHPLLKTPLGKLHLGSEPYTDDLLEGVLARARQEVPDI
jgi:hypothetical protein